MQKYNTIFGQLLKFFSRFEFEKFVKEVGAERHARGVSSWDHFVALMFAQLAGQESLRCIEAGMATQINSLYHLGAKLLNRSSLSYANNHRPATLFEKIFYFILAKCQNIAPKHKFKFKNPLYSIDSTVIELCLSLFEWAKYQKSKGAIRLHFELDHSGYLPKFMVLTTGKVSEHTIAKEIKFKAGDVVVFDRGFLDFGFLNSLDNKGVFYVTRFKSNSAYKVIERKEKTNKNILADQIIELTVDWTHNKYPKKLRRIRVKDPETGKSIVIITNNFKWAATTIAKIYKERWQIELFFKAIKQNLNIKNFIGVSLNAMLSQIWIALIVYLLINYIKFKSKIGLAFSTIISIIPLNLFSRRNLWDFLKYPNKPKGICDLEVLQMTLDFG